MGKPKFREIRIKNVDSCSLISRGKVGFSQVRQESAIGSRARNIKNNLKWAAADQLPIRGHTFLESPEFKSRPRFTLGCVHILQVFTTLSVNLLCISRIALPSLKYVPLVNGKGGIIRTYSRHIPIFITLVKIS